MSHWLLDVTGLPSTNLKGFGSFAFEGVLSGTTLTVVPPGEVVTVPDGVVVTGGVVTGRVVCGDDPGRHCEYQSLLKTHVLPDTHVVGPVQPCPPPAGAC